MALLYTIASVLPLVTHASTLKILGIVWFFASSGFQWGKLEWGEGEVGGKNGSGTD